MNRFLRKIRIGWKFISLLLLTLAAFSYAMFQGGFVSWFLFYSFMPFAIYSLLLLIYPVRSFEVTRKVNQEQFTYGQRFVATITVKRKIPFPLFYLIVEDELTDRLQGSRKLSEPKKMFFPWFKRELSYEYVLQQIPRGEHHLSTIRLRTGDLFGLIEKEVFVHVEHRFLVYPSTIDVTYKPKQRQFEQGMSSNKARYLQDSTIAVGIREYQPGDKFAWIDWKATARRDSLMTKEFEQLQSHDVVIIMDRVQSDVFERIVLYSASLVRSLLKSGARVGFISIGSQKHIFPLKADDQHLKNIFYHLAKVDCDIRKPLSSLLEGGLLNTEMKQVTNIIVTGHITLDFVRRIEYLGGGQQMFVVFVIKQDAMTKEEQVLIERLTKRHIEVNVVTGHTSHKEVMSS